MIHRLIYKVSKSFRNGKNEDHLLIEYDDEYWSCEEVCVDESVKDWGERSDGGHSYGYSLYWEKIEKPSDEVLDKLISRSENEIERYKSSIENAKEELLYLKTKK